MRKINIITIKGALNLLTGLVLIISSSCSGGKETKSSDSVVESVDSIPYEDRETMADILLCADSIYSAGGGSLAVGTPISTLPEAMEGLYDNIEREESESTTDIRFRLGEEYIFTGLDFGSGKIDLIMANTMHVRAAGVGDTGISLSSPFSEVLDLAGVVPEWCDYDDSGMWYWTWHGLWFAPDQSHLTPSLSRSLYNEDTLPTSKDFDDSVVVGYLGTGCPF